MRIVSMIVVCCVALLPAASYASPECPTKAEARTKWPKAHLWWSGPNKCWSNRRGAFSHQPPIRQKPTAKEPVSSVMVQHAQPEPPRTPVMTDQQEAERSMRWVFAPVMRRAAFLPWDAMIMRTDDDQMQEPSGTVVYSSFAGEPPDVWPDARPIDHDDLLSFIGRTVLAILLGVVLCFVVVVVTIQTRRFDMGT